MFKRNKIKPSLPKEILQEYYEQYGKDKVFCRAPFNSLYFFKNGDVAACCINRNHFIYNSYRTHSLNEIINSDRRKQLQKHIRKHNLNLGCSICQNEMMSKNFSNVLATFYRKQKMKKHQITRIDFELSNNCNLDCIMCFRGYGSAYSAYDDKFLQELRPFLNKIKFANFIGGEPFIIDIYYKIWDYLLKNNSDCNINIQTNGTILNDKNIELIKSPNVSIVMSIDSVNSTTYENIRVGAKFENVLSNFRTINKIMQGKDMNMHISTCPITLNAYEIPDLVNFANENNCKIFFNYTTNPPYLSLKYLNSQKILDIISYYEAYIKQLGNTKNKIEKNNFLALNGLINLLKSWYHEKLDTNLNSIEISKSKVYDILAMMQNNKQNNIIEQFKTILPESWKISQALHKKIMTKDFDMEIAFLNEYQNQKNDLLKILNTYFELPSN